MNIKNKARAVLFGIVIAAGAVSTALATSDLAPPVSRTQVMTDSCANVMNWPLRSIALQSTPPSERGLQCPIQEQFTAPLDY